MNPGNTHFCYFHGFISPVVLTIGSNGEMTQQEVRCVQCVLETKEPLEMKPIVLELTNDSVRQ